MKTDRDIDVATRSRLAVGTTEDDVTLIHEPTTPAPREGLSAERLLRRVEWVQPMSNSMPSCPVCGSFDKPNHALGCALDAALHDPSTRQPLPVDPDLRAAAWRLSNAAESLARHAKHPDDQAHRAWFPSAISDVDREVGVTRQAVGRKPTPDEFDRFAVRLREGTARLAAPVDPGEPEFLARQETWDLIREYVEDPEQAQHVLDSLYKIAALPLARTAPVDPGEGYWDGGGRHHPGAAPVDPGEPTYGRVGVRHDGKVLQADGTYTPERVPAPVDPGEDVLRVEHGMAFREYQQAIGTDREAALRARVNAIEARLRLAALPDLDVERLRKAIVTLWPNDPWIDADSIAAAYGGIE